MRGIRTNYLSYPADGISTKIYAHGEKAQHDGLLIIQIVLLLEQNTPYKAIISYYRYENKNNLIITFVAKTTSKPQ